MWYWIILSLIPLTGVVFGLIDGIREQKHKKTEETKKSYAWLWLAVITFGILAGLFPNDKKKK